MNQSTTKNFSITKIKNFNDPEISRNIRDVFHEPSKYFTKMEDTIIGKKIVGPRFNGTKVIPYTIVGTSEEFTRLNQLKTRAGSKKSIKTVNTEPENNKIEHHNYTKINDNQMNNLIDTVKNRVRLNSTKINRFYYDVPVFYKNKIKLQEKSLELTEKYFDNDRPKIERILTSKTKKSEKDLLFNKTDFFRKKKEIREFYENSRPLDETYGKNSWIMCLRRPKNFKGTRFGYINVGTPECPSWAVVKETLPKENTKIRVIKTETDSNTDNFTKSDYFKSKVHLDLQKKNECLEIIGNNLLTSEIHSARGIHGKKILYMNDIENPVEEFIGIKYQTATEFYKKQNKYSQKHIPNHKYF